MPDPVTDARGAPPVDVEAIRKQLRRLDVLSGMAQMSESASREMDTVCQGIAFNYAADLLAELDRLRQANEALERHNMELRAEGVDLEVEVSALRQAKEEAEQHLAIETQRLIAEQTESARLKRDVYDACEIIDARTRERNEALAELGRLRQAKEEAERERDAALAVVKAARDCDD